MSTDGFEIHVPDGTSSIAEIEYNFFREIYFEYNQGHDEFHDQEEQLKIDLMEANGIDEEVIENLKGKLQKVAKENKSLKEDTGDVEALTDESENLLGDIKKIQEHIEKQKNYMTHRQTDLKTTSQNLKECEKRHEELKDSIVHLESECRDKGIDPKDNSNHAEEFVLALQARVEAKKDDVNEADKLMRETQCVAALSSCKTFRQQVCTHVAVVNPCKFASMAF